MIKRRSYQTSPAVRSKWLHSGILFPALALMWCTSGTAWAGTRIALPNALAAEPGELLVVPVSLDYAQGVMGYFLEVTFDPALFSVSNVASGSLTDNWGSPAFKVGTGSIFIAGAGATRLSGAGTLAQIHFDISNSALNGESASLGFRQAELNDGSIPADTNSCQVMIDVAVELSVPATVKALPGDYVQVPIVVSDSNGLVGYYVEIAYDHQILEYTSSYSGELTEPWGTPVVNNKDGVVTLASSGIVPLTGEGSLAVVRLKVKDLTPLGSRSDILLIATELNDGAIAALARHGAVSVLNSPSDVNEDFNVDALDVQLAINAALGMEIAPFSADVDEDGNVSAVDVQLVILGALGSGK